MKPILPFVIAFISVFSANAQNRASCLLGDNLRLQM